MNKLQKLHKKQEKQLVKLMYKKGIIDELKVVNDISELYWQDYAITKGKYSSGKWKHDRRLVEVYYSTTDYWGEGNEHSLVGMYRDVLYWSNYILDDESNEPVFKKIDYGRINLIRRLRKMKIIHNDNKINMVIKKAVINY